MIGRPVPQAGGQPVLRGFLAAGFAAFLGLALAVRVVEPPRPATLFNQVIVVHDSLIPSRIDVASPSPDEPESPHLLASMWSILEGRRVDSWLYQLGRDRISVHRLDARPEVPRNAQKLSVKGGSVDIFELSDLTLLAWPVAPDRTLVVVGSSPVPRLRDLAEWVRESGPGTDQADQS